jgi:hypothetical protein
MSPSNEENRTTPDLEVIAAAIVQLTLYLASQVRFLTHARIVFKASNLE